jgi:hypothetical protein
MIIYVNDLKIEATNVQESTVSHDGKERRAVSFDFKVRSEDSHRVTTELYKNDFLLSIPEKNIEFPCVISNYSTSITDLSVEEVADFKLELMEK